MPRIGYADSPSFRRLRADDLQSSRLPPDRGQPCAWAKVPVRRAFGGRWRHGREARGAQDAYQRAARVRLAL